MTVQVYPAGVAASNISPTDLEELHHRTNRLRVRALARCLRGGGEQSRHLSRRDRLASSPISQAGPTDTKVHGDRPIRGSRNLVRRDRTTDLLDQFPARHN